MNQVTTSDVRVPLTLQNYYFQSQVKVISQQPLLQPHFFSINPQNNDPIRRISMPVSLMTPALLPISSRHVAVIGAGAAGLVAAKELLREGHRVVVFERGDQVGGTWVYTPVVESDPMGLDPRRSVVHSSLYESLRTNLPREIMGFRDYPFVPKHAKLRDPRRFPGHAEVLMYLQDFAAEFGVDELVRFQTEVMRVGLVDGGKWRVVSRRRGQFEFDLGVVDEVFDAVVVCNGHYTEPRIADDVPGIETWPGKQIHSHNYRVPEPFRDQVVILIGSSASAVDISRDIARVAKEVHVASRSSEDRAIKCQGYNNLWFHSMIQRTREDGTVVFHDGTVVLADVILHCTGYKFHFPFLETNGIVTVEGNCVGPLYKHVFPPVLAPGLSFVGLPWKVVPFCLCELQSQWIAGALSGRISLPSQDQMSEDIRAFYSKLEASGIPKRYTHNLGGTQFEYNDWVAVQCSVSGPEEWRKEMYVAASKNRVARPETYRDEWEDDHLVLQAHQDFKRYST